MLARSANPVSRDGLANWGSPATRNRTSLPLGADRSHKATPCGQVPLSSIAWRVTGSCANQDGTWCSIGHGILGMSCARKRAHPDIHKWRPFGALAASRSR